MISKETMEEVVEQIERWQKAYDIPDNQVHVLLKRIGTVQGNMSFKSSIWLLYCRMKGMNDQEREIVMRAKCGLQLPTKRRKE